MFCTSVWFGHMFGVCDAVIRFSFIHSLGEREVLDSPLDVRVEELQHADLQRQVLLWESTENITNNVSECPDDHYFVLFPSDNVWVQCNTDLVFCDGGRLLEDLFHR